MFDALNTNLYALWFSIGFALLTLEALAFGFSSGLLLFGGIGALLTGALLWAGLLPATWTASIACFSIASTASAVSLWKVMRRRRDDAGSAPRDTSSDLIGLRFRLQDPTGVGAPGSTRYSGIRWRVEIDETGGPERLEAGRLVEVVSVDAGVFRVRPVAEVVSLDGSPD